MVVRYVIVCTRPKIIAISMMSLAVIMISFLIVWPTRAILKDIAMAYSQLQLLVLLVQLSLQVLLA